MKRTRFTDEQIIGILAEHEAGAKCAEGTKTLARQGASPDGVTSPNSPNISAA